MKYRRTKEKAQEQDYTSKCKTIPTPLQASRWQDGSTQGTYIFYLFCNNYIKSYQKKQAYSFVCMSIPRCSFAVYPSCFALASSISIYARLNCPFCILPTFTVFASGASLSRIRCSSSGRSQDTLIFTLMFFSFHPAARFWCCRTVPGMAGACLIRFYLLFQKPEEALQKLRNQFISLTSCICKCCLFCTAHFIRCHT